MPALRDGLRPPQGERFHLSPFVLSRRASGESKYGNMGARRALRDGPDGPPQGERGFVDIGYTKGGRLSIVAEFPEGEVAITNVSDMGEQ